MPNREGAPVGDDGGKSNDWDVLTEEGKEHSEEKLKNLSEAVKERISLCLFLEKSL